jgi:circadian clock protein KaiC
MKKKESNDIIVEKVIPENRCPTGIPGFDDLCQGGLYRNSINALLGGPGAGKTTFLLQFLYNGVHKYNEPGLYVSFESHDEDVFNDAKTYGWDFLKLHQEGKCYFMRISPKITVDELRHKIEMMVIDKRIKRVCLDPISLLSIYLKNDPIIREIVYNLTLMLKRLKITTIIADETIEGTVENFSLGNNEQRTTAIKFLSDGLINLYSSGLGGESDRAIRITKMRRTNHARGPVPFRITRNGISVISS